MAEQNTVNNFMKGLDLSSFPANISNDKMSDALNATIYTLDGDDFVLQNDMGNITHSDWKLSEGFIPVGLKEYGGIMYIISYNPDTHKGEIGTFPAPANLDPKEYSSIVDGGQSSISNLTLCFSTDNRSFIKNVSMGQYLSPGDIFTVACTGIDVNHVNYKLCTLTKDNMLVPLDVEYNVEGTTISVGDENNLVYYNHKVSGQLCWLFELKSVVDFSMNINMDKDSTDKVTLTFTPIIVKEEADNWTHSVNEQVQLNNITLTKIGDNYEIPKSSWEGKLIYYSFSPVHINANSGCATNNVTLSDWNVTGVIDPALIGSGKLDLSKWKYIIKNNILILNWACEHYPKVNSKLFTCSIDFCDLLGEKKWYSLPQARAGKENWTGEYIDKFPLKDILTALKKDRCYAIRLTFDDGITNQVIYKVLSTFNLYEDSLYYNEEELDYSIKSQKLNLSLLNKSKITKVDEKKTFEYTSAFETSGNENILFTHPESLIEYEYTVDPEFYLQSNNDSLFVAIKNSEDIYEVNKELTTVTVGFDTSPLVENIDNDSLNGDIPTIGTFTFESPIEQLSDESQREWTIETNGYSYETETKDWDNSGTTKSYKPIEVKLTSNNGVYNYQSKLKSYIFANKKSEDVTFSGYQLRPYFDPDDSARMIYLFGFDPYDENGIPRIRQSWGLWHHTYTKSLYDPGDDYAGGHKKFNRSAYRIHDWNYNGNILTITRNGLDETTITETENSKFDFDIDFPKVVKKYRTVNGSVPQIIFSSAYNAKGDEAIEDIPSEYKTLFPVDCRLHWGSLSNTSSSNWVGVMWKGATTDKTDYRYFDWFYQVHTPLGWNNSWTASAEGELTLQTNSGLMTRLNTVFSKVFVPQISEYSQNVLKADKVEYNKSYEVVSTLKYSVTTPSQSNIKIYYNGGDPIIDAIKQGLTNINGVNILGEDYTSENKPKTNALIATIEIMFDFNYSGLSSTLTGNWKINDKSMDIEDLAIDYQLSSKAMSSIGTFVLSNGGLITKDSNGMNFSEKRAYYQKIVDGNTVFELLTPNSKIGTTDGVDTMNFNFQVQKDSESEYNLLVYANTANKWDNMYVGAFMSDIANRYVNLNVCDAG